ncbi:MAG: hypothetical protein IT210_12075 [Armatimonadetes bacterium]|nr:hypothetical protein [Armatimonadota bacterium]
MMFLKGWTKIERFTDQLSDMAVRQLIQPDRSYPKTDSLPAQWILGLTDKQVQNVLRDKRDNLYRYKHDVDSVIEKAAE